MAYLLKSNISNADDEINGCMNFLEYLAFEIYRKGSGERSIGQDVFDDFKMSMDENSYLSKNRL